MMYSRARKQGFTHLRETDARKYNNHCSNIVLCAVYADLIQKYRLERHKTKSESRQQKMFNCLSELLHSLKPSELTSSRGESVLGDLRKWCTLKKSVLQWRVHKCQLSINR